MGCQQLSVEVDDSDPLVFVPGGLDVVGNARCWQYRKDIGTDKDHPEVCGRCAAVLNAQEKAG